MTAGPWTAYHNGDGATCDVRDDGGNVVASSCSHVDAMAIATLPTMTRILEALASHDGVSDIGHLVRDAEATLIEARTLLPTNESVRA